MNAPIPEWLTVVLKALAGGSLVVAFALLSESLEPKRFAGLLSAAPAIAIASLILILATKDSHAAREASIGMLAGAVGMIAYAASMVKLISRARPYSGPALGLLVWGATAAAVGAFLP